MSSVSISGLVSGINVQSLITTLSAAYQQPITLLQNQEQSYQTTLSAWGSVQNSLSSLQSAVGSLQNVTSLNNRTVNLNNTSAVSGTASANAPLGSYSLSNIVLAQTQSVYSQDFTSATNTAVGTGTLQIQVGSGSVTNISIGSGNNTLNGIAAAINGSNSGVNAAVIYDGTGYRLTLTGNNTGAANAFTVSTSGATGALAALSYSAGASGGMTQSQTAQNASVSINGLAITSATNTVSGAIPGVSLNLLQASGSTTLTVANDSSAFVTSVQSFVTAFNSTMSTLNQLTAFNGGTGTSGSSGQSGPLIGNAGIQTLRTQLLNLISGQGIGTTPGSSYTSLGAVGLSLAQNGTLVLNSGTLNQALSSNYNAVAGLFGQVGSATNANVQYIGAGNSTQPGTYAVNVTTPAAQASVTAANPIASGGLSSAETLVIGSGATSVSVQLASGATISAIVATINATLTQQGLSNIAAINNNGSLQFQSSGYGSAQSFTVVSTQAASSGSTGIGTTLLTGKGMDVLGSINGQTGSGAGQQLTATGPGAALGLQVSVTGQGTGSLGTVTVSQGIYQQMNAILTQALNTQSGFVSAATSGINSTITSINQQITQLQSSATAQTALLQQQFNAMQTQVAQLQSVGQYLTAFFNTGSSSSSSSTSG
ncbi:putative Flagellar hook-associated protein 2 (FliD) [Thiomonas sp. X19]|uniref:flagellar filament capping protein FliD n=1 Tax=Thiomonas sp. X19 TaxID=1050370 RepID=UPI000B68DD6E|nr:flagellar filament capping protein FliD [Thiomonas sp. X19]SCC91061.1 putative Flagellar hook-associated protein 2 (FliD) [Thiomonas sp. X19]